MSFGGFFKKWRCCCSTKEHDSYESDSEEELSSDNYAGLNYENIINAVTCNSDDDLYVGYLSFGCIYLGLKAKEILESYKVKFGWKLHIGIHYEDIPKAWTVLKDILIHHEIFQSKYMLQENARKAQTDPNGHGREITIYTFNEPEERNDWNELIRKIEDRLEKIGIRDIETSPACVQLRDCKYISCRCDQGKRDDEYLAYDRAIKKAAKLGTEAYNPHNRKPPVFLEGLIEKSSPKSSKMEM